MVKIQTQLSQGDYIKASIIILYRKPLISIVAFLLFILVCANITMLLLGFRISGDMIALPLVLLFVTPFSTYITARRNYRANKTAHLLLNYEFRGEMMTVTADRSRLETKIGDLKKVFKNNNWIFIMNSSRNVNPIPRRDVSDEQLADLKRILNDNGVRNNL